MRRGNWHTIARERPFDKVESVLDGKVESADAI